MSVRKRGNCYQVIYRCVGEKSPRTETFKSEDEAKIRDMQIKLAKKNKTFEAPVRIEKGIVRQDKEIKLKDFLSEYVEMYGLKKWGNSYYGTTKSLIRNYINPYIGERYVKSFTSRDIDAYYTMLLNQPAVLVQGHRDTGEKISASTVGRIHKVLKSAFGKAVVWDYIKTNPTIGVTLPKYKQTERAVWSDEEAINALRICDDPALKLCLYLALGCSLRLGEILGLQWANVHITENPMIGESYIKIDRELNRCSNESIEALERVNRSTILLKFPQIMPKKATTTLVLKSPKTESSNRIIYLPQAVTEELQKTQRQQSENKAILGEEYHDFDLVVAHINGRPYEMRTVDQMLYKMIDKHSLRPVVFHSLRHSSTSLKLKLSRGNIKAVQGDTGHAEARMVTDTYAHSFDNDRKLIAQEMDSGFFARVEADKKESALSGDTVQMIKQLLKSNPELLSEILAQNTQES